MRSPPSLLHHPAPAPGDMPSSSPPPHPEQQQQQQLQQQTPVLAVNSDMVVILASLLCALVCVLGLALVSRCACRRRRSSSTSADPPPKGLKKKAIDALPTVSFGAAAPKSASACASPPSECSICLAEFAEGEELRVLPRCGHRFHVACVDAWLRTRATCPSCRATCIASTAQAAPPVVVVTGSRCGRCGEVAPSGSRGGAGDDTFLP